MPMLFCLDCQGQIQEFLKGDVLCYIPYIYMCVYIYTELGGGLQTLWTPPLDPPLIAKGLLWDCYCCKLENHLDIIHIGLFI
jgi:hypothetical protein